MEALTGIMKKAASVGLFNGIKINSDGLSLSYLIYADDVMFIGEWSVANVNNLRRILRCFYLVSGLKVNLAKCSIYGVGVNEEEVQNMAQLLRCRQGLGPTAIGQLQQLMSMLCSCSVSSGLDRWNWRYETNGSFSVSSIKQILSTMGRVRTGSVFEWNNWVPKKVGIVVWRAEMERLPTKCALARRNVQVPNLMCALCGDYEESCDHLFVSCHFAQTVWQNLAGWCRIPPIIAFGMKDLLTLHGSDPGSRRKKVIHAVILVAFWSIWKIRNDVVFRQAVPNFTRTLDEIKSMAYLWIKNRSKVAALTWEDWNRFNLGVM
ncbi:uncharacterized protein LOC110942467 [Helianthus annuus]|uniref:uncharacterized protein LOC110942467 n=1 Tax=Helianthus annuus TaxID=4232 RepID=UPI000B8EF4A0|nr:uncharacterized protein LOC110942467 [Helianthus annuus]